MRMIYIWFSSGRIRIPFPIDPSDPIGLHHTQTWLELAGGSNFFPRKICFKEYL